jgi:hypothetical protein
LMLPCRHLALCQKCYRDWCIDKQKETCPICRAKIMCIKIYQEQDANVICSVCEISLANVVASWCQHRVACKECLKSMKKPFCPKCHNNQQKFYLDFHQS